MQKDLPKLISALTCDQVRTEKNDKHILIGLFSNIKVKEFPAFHSSMTFFCGWLNTGRDEIYNLKVVVLGPQGEELAKITKEIKFSREKIITYAIFNFNGLPLKKPGIHKFQAFFNEIKVAETLVKVEKLSN